MKKLAIVADSSHDITFETAHQYGLELLPYSVQMGDNHYTDLVDISSREFYERMKNYDVLSTGIPPIQKVFDLLDRLKSEGYEQALLISMSDKVSGMFQMYQLVQSQYEGLEIFTFNTHQIAGSAGLFSIYASEMREQGKTVEEILEELIRVHDHTTIYALFRTLKYVVKGGRFNKYKGMLGQLLNIHPILQTVNGEVGVVDKIRGQKKSLTALVNRIKSEIGNSQKYRMIIFSGNNDEEVELLKEQLKSEIEKAQLFIQTELTPVLGVHAGPKSLGVSIMKIDSDLSNS